MMAGKLEIWLDELECHTLNDGDSFWFESTLGHRWYNPSTEEAVLLWIIPRQHSNKSNGSSPWTRFRVSLTDTMRPDTKSALQN